MNNIEDFILKSESEKVRIQLNATYKTLIQVDDIINYHNNNNETNHAAVVIDIYGLLQSLFVGIDALYELSIGITKNKFYININQNATLNNLKSIRNDIVGHPVDRKYGDSGTAYSTIRLELLRYDYFYYDTYISFHGKSEKKETEVDLKNLKFEYIKEKNIILDRLEDFINNKKPKTNLNITIEKLYHDYSMEKLLNIKKLFIENYGNITEHRFMWRIRLLEKLYLWKEEDKLLNEVIIYMIHVQTEKLLEIITTMEEKSYFRRSIKIPYLLKKTFKYLDKNSKYVPYIKNLHDVNSTYYKQDLSYLISEIKDVNVLKLFNFLERQKDRDKIYLLGSIIKKYRIK